MKCENCSQNDADYHATRITGGRMCEEHLCMPCAKELGKISEFKTLTMGSVFKPALETILEDNRKIISNEKKCPVCGTTENSLFLCGQIGCSQCYHVFSSVILDAVRQSQNSNTIHVGKRGIAK